MVSAQMRELVRAATLAASGHNTQPWTFAITDQAIDIYPDLARRLPAVDRSDRELWISLGCALENLIVAARAAGYVPDITYPDAADFIHIQLTPGTSPASPLFDAIRVRQNTRSAYDGQPLPTADLNTVQAMPLEPGVVLQLITSPTEVETVLEYVNQGNLRQFADTAFMAELMAWIRFTKKEALASRDGLYAGASGNPEVPRWLGQLVVAGTQPQQQADADAKKLRSSAGAMVVASESDTKTAWVRTGQVYERLALTLTALKIQSAFLNQPIEVAAVRGQFQSAMGLGAALPQLLMRVGYAAPMPRSLRRPVEQVIMQMHGEAFINRSAAPNPWVLFLAIYVLSVPLLVLGSLTNARLMPGLPLSALMFVSTAAVAFWVAYRTGGRAGLRALLGRVFDVAAIPEPGLGLQPLDHCGAHVGCGGRRRRRLRGAHAGRYPHGNSE